ncbi:DUF1788 domain-containing protein [Saccharicrinis fermentans]|uniref:DUF1788 domain-containing protein n=1 Tax=Saccharicrinis fermentans DSM 9555 = JCM 21142 TaxID=869213 RepID=W7YAN7_9BACT|nr:DUF1788 domain-containing protein [Saccharicrinis fermentans]GAF04633.1 hypothetical protein JCM21142_93345 [Saccharicrinis fermentans DSM 9555 = JCM 21142]
MKDISEKFDHLYKVISSKSFLNKEALGGEIPFFISAYDAKKELLVDESIKLLINKLDTSGVPVLELNLYELVCEILENKGGVERMFKVEKLKSKEKFLRALQSSLNIHQVLMPLIQRKIEQANAHVYFLTGIGKVFPFIRSHNVLNNLQNIAKEAPTVAFFPGDYNGHTLNLFGLLKDDNYYRAFNIEKIEA